MIDDILEDIEYKNKKISISEQRAKLQREKIQSLRNVAATEVYIVTSRADKDLFLYNFCRKHGLKYSNLKGYKPRTLMSKEQYFMCGWLGTTDYKIQYFAEITNQQLLSNGLL